MAKLKLSTNNVINCIVYAVIGLLLVILKSGSLGILMTVVGAMFIVMGIVDILKSKDLVKGIIELAIGVAIIVCGWIVADIVLLVFGIFLIVKGIIEVAKYYKSGFKALLSPIVTIVIGVLLVIAKWTLMDVMCIVAGVIFLINAVLALFGRKIAKK